MTRARTVLATPPARGAPVRVALAGGAEAARAALARAVSAAPGVHLAGTFDTTPGAVGDLLRARPDLVALDLEGPGPEPLAFLEALVERRMFPVLVVASSASKVEVFRALELGALDLVPRAEGDGAPDAVAAELLSRVATVRLLRLDNLEPVPRRELGPPRRRCPVGSAVRVAVIGASMGGPSALKRLLAALPADLPLALAVAQHMPERFTSAFARRLSADTGYPVAEAADGDLLAPGRALLAPGGRHLALERGPASAVRARVVDPDQAGRGSVGRRWCPSIDLLFESAARAAGEQLCAVVLTGMGSDGRAGVVAVKGARGLTLAESEGSAVIWGMPGEAVATGRVDEVLPLDGIVERLVHFARGRPA